MHFGLCQPSFLPKPRYICWLLFFKCLTVLIISHQLHPTTTLGLFLLTYSSFLHIQYLFCNVIIIHSVSQCTSFMLISHFCIHFTFIYHLFNSKSFLSSFFHQIWTLHCIIQSKSAANHCFLDKITTLFVQMQTHTYLSSTILISIISILYTFISKYINQLRGYYTL